MALFPWHHRWNVLALMVLAQALLVGFQTFCFAFWVVPWIAEFGAPQSQFMLMISANALIIGFVSPLAGALYDRYPARVLFLAGNVVFALSFLAMSFATSHWMLLFLYACVLPIGIVLDTSMVAQILVARWFQTNRGLATGIGAVGVSLGAFMMPPIATALLAGHGWRATFQIMTAVIFLVIAPLSWIVLGKQAKDDPDAAAHAHAAAQDPANSVSWTTAQLLRNRNFWIIAFAFFAIMAGCLPVMYAIGTYAKALGISQQDASFAAAMMGITLALGKVSFGKLADVLPHHLSYWLAATIMIVGVTLLGLASNVVLFGLGLMLLGFGQGCMLPLSSGMVLTYFGSRAFGQVLGLAFTIFNLGAMAPFLAALLRDAGMGYPSSFAVMLVPLLVAAISLRWLSRPAGNAAVAHALAS